MTNDYERVIHEATDYMQTDPKKMRMIETAILMERHEGNIDSYQDEDIKQFIQNAAIKWNTLFGLLPIQLDLEILKERVAYTSNGIVFKIIRKTIQNELVDGELSFVTHCKNTCLLTNYAENQGIGVHYIGCIYCNLQYNAHNLNDVEPVYIIMTELCDKYTYTGPPLSILGDPIHEQTEVLDLIHRITHSNIKVHGDFCAKNIVKKENTLYAIDIDAAEAYNRLNHERYQELDYIQVMIERFNSALPGGSGLLIRSETKPNYRAKLIKARNPNGLLRRRNSQKQTRKNSRLNNLSRRRSNTHQNMKPNVNQNATQEYVHQNDEPNVNQHATQGGKFKKLKSRKYVKKNTKKIKCPAKKQNITSVNSSWHVR